MASILIDGIYIRPDMKGIGRYATHVLGHLSALDETFHLSVLIPQNVPSDCLPHRPNIHYLNVPWWNYLWHGFWTLPMWTMRLGPDLVWVPYETPLGSLNKPYLMLCHDVPRMIRVVQKKEGINLKSIGACLKNCLYDHLLERSLRSAALVFSNSHYVADWLEKGVGVRKSQIRLAPCAPGADFRRLSQDVVVESVRKRLGTPDGYILVFYTGDQRENFDIVPAVYRRIVESGLPHALVVAGVKDNVRPYIESSLSGFHWRDRVRIVPFLGSGKEQELAAVYKAAAVYLDPSLHEGFGMQVIEAMACGKPVVCSNRGALPEVVGDAALLVNPENHDEIALAVIKVISDQKLSNQFVERGYERSASYSWKRTANVIYKGLLDVLNMDFGN